MTALDTKQPEDVSNHQKHQLGVDTMASAEVVATLKRYEAGKELLEMLEASVKPKDVADRVAALAAKIADEASAAAAGATTTTATNKAGAPAANGDAAAAAAAAAASAAAFAAAKAVLEGVNLTNPWGKHDVGFGADAVLLRSGKGGVVSVPYSDIEHVAVRGIRGRGHREWWW